MADEATAQINLTVRKVSGAVVLIEHFGAGPSSFTEDVDGTKGPSPGAFTATIEGTDVDFSALTTPWLCEFHNQDAVNFVDIGIWDPEGSKFYPFMRLNPGKKYIIPLSPDLQEEFGTGTGTTGADTNRLRVKADTASVVIYVGAFDAG